MRSNRFQSPRVAFPGSGEREPRLSPHAEGRVVGIITAGGVLIEAGRTERTRGAMTDDRDRISHRPSAIPNGPLTESGRAGLSFNPSASLPARPDRMSMRRSSSSARRAARVCPLCGVIVASDGSVLG